MMEKRKIRVAKTDGNEWIVRLKPGIRQKFKPAFMKWE
jgi:hypothetical protein